MNYKIKFSKAAVEDLDNTFEYIAMTLKSPIAARNLMKRIEKSIMNLKQQPFLCPVCNMEALHDLGYRKLVVKNYIIIYSVNEKDETVYIVRMFYGKQNYDKYIK